MISRSRFLSTVLGMLLAPYSASASTYYCPWADAVVKLDITADRKSVALKSALYSDWPNRVELSQAKAHPVLPPDFEFRYFSISDASYTYEFWIHFNGEDVGLTNHRTRFADGRMWRQRAYCMKAD